MLPSVNRMPGIVSIRLSNVNEGSILAAIGSEECAILARVGDKAPELLTVRAPGLWARLLSWRGPWRPDDLQLPAWRRNDHLLRDIGLDRSSLDRRNVGRPVQERDLWY
ncbi:hypothetical protein [Pararhizobium sp.]|uniref:hypothetical protein n=1 Tax=Pararhizobium sp. TaxID=1977563 RepID=UPI002719F046|nr:hypothetical protein [Pararhizobium sp.]MDO9414760.1 hypothetical protein [Pararhizobium sp.]